MRAARHHERAMVAAANAQKVCTVTLAGSRTSGELLPAASSLANRSRSLPCDERRDERYTPGDALSKEQYVASEV